ncbi:MAG TPA: twin-arginine translocase TatA/TatE family subunit [Acidimicrobiales bacterium]|jgi:sec-independent protein translocase protein TatA|nr:twin-arginine translocase TatA/TatE family subunit [Acidimicrobiales bacterium]
MFAFLEGPELIIVLVIVLVVFGGSQLPKLARNLGEAKREFESGMENKDGSDTKSDKPSDTSNS